MKEKSIRLHAHRPERRRVRPVTLHGACCCTCCCCCAHTLGGLVGAAFGSAVASERRPIPPPHFNDALYEEPPDLMSPREAISAVAVYWLVFLGTSGLYSLARCAGVGPAWLGPDIHGDPPRILFELAFVLPAIQLVACILAIPFAALTNRANAARRIWAVGKITLGFLIGAGVGTALMFLACGGLRLP